MIRRELPLTEEKWLASSLPHEMLGHLCDRLRVARVAGGRRRLRLFCAACCRSVWGAPDQTCRQAVEVSERYADGEARKAELATAHEGAVAAHRAADQTATVALAAGGAVPSELLLRERATRAAERALKPRIGVAARSVANTTANIRPALAPEGPYGPGAGAIGQEWSHQAGLLRCIFGNPFRPVAVDGAWAAWRGGTAARLARAIYDERAFGRLPFLADALEEAGCPERAILAHCRGPGPHARGCWVVDLLLGKK